MRQRKGTEIGFFLENGSFQIGVPIKILFLEHTTPANLYAMDPKTPENGMTLPRFDDLGDGILCIDTGLYRHGLAACYLIRERERLALVDTGTAHTVPRLLELIAARGLSPEQVKYVIPTHVHLDHAGGAGALMAACPNARLVIHPKGVTHMIDPAKLTAGASAVYGEEAFARDFGELIPIEGERVIPATDGMELDLAGRSLTFIDTPGHANHHGCLFDTRGRGFFTGDTFGISYRELDTENGPFLFAPTTPVAFDPEAWLESVKKYRPTRAVLLPAQLLDAVEHEKAQSVDFSSLKEVMVGGGMVSHDLYVQFRKAAGFELMEGYGLTECEGNCLPRYYELVKPGSVGKPRVGVEIRLADQAGNEVETGTIGEIWIKSDSVMAGYWEDPENTEKTYADGWLKTGDLALRDEDGYLYFTGRIKELIIKGGSNVSPGEVEEVLDDHPDIVISGVVGTADAHYGELIHAFVEMKAGLQTPATVEQLTRYASEKLAAYKVPDRWTILEKLPRNKVGKIDRASLHAMAAEIDV